MSVARSAIRQQVAQNLPGVLVGTVASATTTLLKDTDEEFVIFGGQGGRDLTGYWIVTPDSAVADQIRRVAHHSADDGEIKPSRAWASAPDADDPYELYPPDMRPTLLNNAINKGLKRLQYTPEESVTPVANQNVYTLSYTWLLSRKDVNEVYWQYTNDNLVSREEYPHWRVFDDSGVFKLHLSPFPSTASGSVVVVEGRANYTSLATDAATTDCPIDWASAVGLVEVFRALRRESPGQDTSRWTAEIIDARRELASQTKKHRPRGGKRVMYRTPWSVNAQQKPRRGEFHYG